MFDWGLGNVTALFSLGFFFSFHILFGWYGVLEAPVGGALVFHIYPEGLVLLWLI